MAARIQAEDFDPAGEIEALCAGRTDIGAVASFVGLVRGAADGVSAMTLEHYPGMAERQFAAIEAEAASRWSLQGIRIVHRHGRLAAGERIVMVAVASAHRGEAFAACEFIMDWLKTKAPFWKCEENPQGRQWVAARAEDDDRAAAWNGEAPGTPAAAGAKDRASSPEP